MSQDIALTDQTCCFTGHRELSPEESSYISEQMDLILPVLYQKGYRRFFSGGACGFDMLAAEAVLRMKQLYPDVQLLLAIPCADQSRSWKQDVQSRYQRIRWCADQDRVLSPHYYQGCMLVRNRYMVDRASYCVCFLREIKGGTAFTVSLAVKKGLRILNLAIPEAIASTLAE